MPNRLPIPSELMSMIEKRDESDRRLEHRRASASKAAAAKAQEADVNPTTTRRVTDARRTIDEARSIAEVQQEKGSRSDNPKIDARTGITPFSGWPTRGLQQQPGTAVVVIRNFPGLRAFAVVSDKIRPQRSMVADPQGCRLVISGTRCSANSLQ